MSKQKKTQGMDWDHFTGQWLRTVRQLRRDSNYCRLALAMARADDHRLGWDEYISLATTWRAIWDDRENEAYARRCAEFAALGWAFEVEPAGYWRARALGIESTAPRLGEVLYYVRTSCQPLREEWDRHYQERKAKRAKETAND